MRCLCLLALAGLLGACTVGPDYRTPEVALPASWSQQRTGGGISADDSWWQTFGDATLEKLVREATAENLDVAQSLARLTQARANLGSARSGLFPTLDGAAAWTASRGLSYSVDGTSSVAGGGSGTSDVTSANSGSAVTSTSGNFGIDASWELDLWGKTRRSVEASKADLAAAAADLRSARLTVLGDVAKAYMDLRTAQARITVGEAAVAGYRDTLVLTRARYKAGLTAETDVLKAEASLAAAEASIPPLSASAAEARHKLAVLMAKAPTEVDTLLQPAQPIPVFGGQVDAGIPADLLRRRPDVVKAERKLAAATARIGVAEAKLLPTLSLSGSLGASQSTTSGVTIGVPGTWSVGPSLSLPIFDAGKLRYDVDAAKASAEEAAGAWHAAVLSALQDVENGFANLRADREKRAFLVRAVAGYARALALAKELYARGLTSFLDVLEAEQSLHSNRDSLVSLEGQIQKDLVGLFKALGGGW
jgi:outer membrane protein, multidrug efflux system